MTDHLPFETITVFMVHLLSLIRFYPEKQVSKLGSTSIAWLGHLTVEQNKKILLLFGSFGKSKAKKRPPTLILAASRWVRMSL